MERPRPIAELLEVPDLQGVLFDIDDTVTWEGRIVPEALLAMRDLQAAGLKVVPVTGRPAGWVDHIARMWPVDGVIGENGGLWFWMEEGRLHRRFLQSTDIRRTNRRRLDALASTILARVPGTRLASDQPYRELDLAVDYCEDVPPLGQDAVDGIVEAFTSAGAQSKISSIHVNGWFGAFDKLEGFRRFHRDRWHTTPEVTHWAFFGDSQNDEPMFRAFPLSVGVRNVERFLDRLVDKPAWITEHPGGSGFVEGVGRLLARPAVKRARRARAKTRQRKSATGR
jgi:HAD superfamily hydrolase (TIGR01484 family)